MILATPVLSRLGICRAIYIFHLYHLGYDTIILHPRRASAAFFAIAVLFFAVSLAARAFPPPFPLLTFPDGSYNSSSISPGAILATIIVHLITSYGLFCPF